MIDIIRDKIYTNITAKQLENVVKDVLKQNNNSDYLKISKTRTGDWTYDMTLVDPSDNSPIIKFKIETITHEVGGYHHTNIYADRVVSDNILGYETLDSIHNKNPKFDKDKIYNFIKKTINNEIDRMYDKEHGIYDRN